MHELLGVFYFTKLDIKLGYHQIRLRKEDISKASFTTHEGHYEFLFVDFGLTNVPPTFKRLMNNIFRLHRKFVWFYFIIFLSLENYGKKNIKHVDKILQILENNKLYVKRSNCSFGKQELKYLGHIVSK